MSSHVSDDEVEWEEIVADTVATVEENTVHTSVEQRLTLPQLGHINDDVEDSEEREGEAGGDHDEADGPEVLVQRHGPIILRGEAQHSSHSSSEC